MPKRAKKYVLPITPFAWIAFMLLFIMSIILLIILKDILFIVLIAITGLSVLYWSIYLIKPLIIDDVGIIRGKNKFVWNDLKVLLYPMNFLWIRGYRYCFVFCKDNCSCKLDIKKQKKAGLYLLLNKENLQLVCQYYNDKIAIVDRDCDMVEFGNVSVKYKDIIDKHNQQFNN